MSRAHDVLWWDLLGLFGFACLALGSYGLFRKATHRFPGPVFLVTYGLVSLSAAIIGGFSFHLHAASSRFPRLPLGSLSLIIGSSTTCALVFVRLLAEEQFGGNVFDLDFGLQWSEAKGIGDSCAMRLRPFAVGHALQGMLAFFLFPAVEYRLHQVDCHLPIIGRILGLLVVGYPLYNLKKRLKKHGGLFAISSFFKNCADWALGFLLGICLGFLVTESGDWSPGVLALKTADVHVHGWESAWDWLEIIRIAAGVLLFLATSRASVQLYLTWDLWPDGVGQKEGHAWQQLAENTEENSDSAEDVHSSSSD